jgi:Zn finger protein HypA/HybF involved in hydrogenase expression
MDEKNKGESIPGLDAIIAKAEHTAVCYECRKDIPLKEWRANARMCKACYDADGINDVTYVD